MSVPFHNVTVLSHYYLIHPHSKNQLQPKYLVYFFLIQDFQEDKQQRLVISSCLYQLCTPDLGHFGPFFPSQIA